MILYMFVVEATLRNTFRIYYLSVLRCDRYFGFGAAIGNEIGKETAMVMKGL